MLGPLGFVCHTNDLKTVCDTVKYVDDSTIWEVCDRKGEDSQIQPAANQTIEWTENNLMETNTDKTKDMVIYYGKRELIAPPIMMNGYEIERVSTSKLLGVILNDTLTWRDHVDYICRKASVRLYFHTLLKRAGYSSPDIVDVYAAITRSVLDACEVWHLGLTKAQSQCSEHIQKRALDISYPDLEYLDALQDANLDSRCETFFHEPQKPEHKLHHLLPEVHDIKPILRTACEREPFRAGPEWFKNSFINYGLFKYQKSQNSFIIF